MIIRKPFAFLVHRFKLLHILILLPVGYLTFMFYRLMKFFNDFVSSGYITSMTQVSNNYFSVLMIIAAIAILIFTILVAYLFYRKKYPNTLYVLLSVLYGIVLVYCFLLPGMLNDAEMALISSSNSLIIRGVTNILFFTQPVAIIVILLLMFGFNIKNGEFNDIKDEINLDEEDSAEFEINIKGDDYKVKRFFRRYSREIKYYVVENKNIFRVLGGIAAVVVLFFSIKYFIESNKTVKVDQSFNYSNLSLSFNSSLLSTLDYNGKQIRDGKIYLANKVSVKNKTNGMQTIETGDFCLEVGKDECIYPFLDKSGLFIDLAKPYYGEKIAAGAENEYVLVYELDESQAKGNYKIKILDSLVYKNDTVKPKYKEISLTPSFSNNVNDVGEYPLNTTVNFNETTLLDTKIKIENVTLSQYFRYNYEYCYEDKCIDSVGSVPADNSSYFVILNADFNLDEKSSYSKNKLGSNNFFKDFGSIEYYIEDKRYVVDLDDVTPKEVNNQIVLQTNSSVRYADKINLIITIRDKRYKLNLK